MDDVTVRDATTEDVPAIRTIAERGWRAAYRDILSTETIDAAIESWYDPETLRESVTREDVAYLVAERDGAVLGYVSGRPTEEDGVASLGAIYVDPDHWQEGVGAALLAAFEDRCRRRGADRIEFRVLSDNDVGKSFYRSQGYERVETADAELFDERVTEDVFRGSVD